MSDLRVGSVFGKAHHQIHGATMIDFISSTLGQGCRARQLHRLPGDGGDLDHPRGVSSMVFVPHHGMINHNMYHQWAINRTMWGPMPSLITCKYVTQGVGFARRWILECLDLFMAKVNNVFRYIYFCKNWLDDDGQWWYVYDSFLANNTGFQWFSSHVNWYASHSYIPNA